jgi:hypothetical protein
MWQIQINSMVMMQKKVNFISHLLSTLINLEIPLHCVIHYRQKELRFFFWVLPSPTMASHESYSSARIQAKLEPLCHALSSNLRPVSYPHHKLQLKQLSSINPDNWNLINGLGNIDFRKHSLNAGFRSFDYTFPRDIQLPQSFSYPPTNILLADHQPSPDRIEFGQYVHNSNPTTNPVSLPIADFPKHIGIFGKPGVGKSKLLQILLEELHRKCPQVGQLYLGIGKAEQYRDFQTHIDLKIAYGDPLFKIPYILFPSAAKSMPSLHSLHGLNSRSPVGDNEQVLRESAKILTAGLGLGNPYDSMFHRVLKHFYSKKQIPETLGLFFKAVEHDHSQSRHQYGTEVQKNILRVFENRKDSLLTQEFLRTTAYSPTLPKWFQYWLEGKSLFLDFSRCNDLIKRMLIFLILQMMIMFFPERDGRLHNVIVIDECHRIFALLQRNSTRETDDSNAAAMMNNLLSRILDEFRSRGLSMILADQNPTHLIPSIYTEPRTRILFNLNDNTSPGLFTNLEGEKRILRTLPERMALVINGNERYICTTRNYFPSEIPPVSKSGPSHQPLNMSPEWHIQQIINQPTYLHPDLWTERCYQTLLTQFKRFLRLHKYSQATLLAYGYWNNRLILNLPRAMRIRVHSRQLFYEFVPLFCDQIPSFTTLFPSIRQTYDWISQYWTQFQDGPLHLTEKLTHNFYLGLKAIHHSLVHIIQHERSSHSPFPSISQTSSNHDNPR